MTALAPAETLAKGRRPLFPGESAEYAKAREALLAEEIRIRRHATDVVEERRALPPGPVVAKDYRFKDENGGDVGLTDMFGEHDTLVTYLWMFGPERERPCPMCTNLLGSVNGNAADIKQRAALKIIGRSPVERQNAFAAERGWRDLDFVQVVGDDYVNDIGAMSPEFGEMAALIVYRKDGDDVRLFWGSEMGMEMGDDGQDPRDYPDLGALWSVLDLTPGGRGTNWYPKLRYD